MIAPDELNERQLALLDQVKAGEVKEAEPDTETQLLTLARLGHLTFEHDADGFHFALSDDAKPKPKRGKKNQEG